MTVGALVLAAGLSRRMGAAKLALPVSGRPMLAATVEAVEAAGLPLLVVIGGHANAVLEAVPGRGTVFAERYARGLSQSLKAGLLAAPEDWAAALVVLGDMPFVRADTLRMLADALRAGARAVVPVHKGRRGNPAGFARSEWPALMALSGDQGARRLLDRLGAEQVPVSDPGIHRDIDVPADLPD